MFFKHEDLEKNQQEVESKLKSDNELRLKINPIRAEVQKEIDKINTVMFSERQYKWEQDLREHFREVFDDSTFNITDAEDLLRTIKEYEKENLIIKGQSFFFTFKGKDIMINSMNRIVLAQKYIHDLEKAIILNYNLTFWDHIKLAFKKLFGGK